MAKKLSRKMRRAAKFNHTQEEKNNLNLSAILPITENQKKTFKEYSQSKNLLLYGTAGTGKTFISLYLAFNEILKQTSKYKKVIVVRSVVPTRDMGFLPGNNKEKAQVYEAPYHSICSEILGRDDAYTLLKSKNMIEFITSSFVRGITLKDCIVIVDEFQNMVDEELHSIITRVGNNCKIIFCGDYTQNDLRKEKTGFHKFIKIISSMNSFGVVSFDINDIVRSSLVKEYIIKRESYENNEISKAISPSTDKRVVPFVSPGHATG